MPILKQFEFNTARVNEVFEGIYSTVILRDVLERNKATDQVLLSKLVMFLAFNIGNVLYNEGELEHKKGKSNVAGKTIDKHIGMRRSAFIFYSVSRYDMKGKQLLETLGKNYMIDLGFRNMLLGYRDVDCGHILENVVFNYFEEITVFPLEK